MTENKSRLDQIKMGIDNEGHQLIDEVVEPEIYDGRKGKVITRHVLLVEPREGVLNQGILPEEGIHRWDESNNRLFAHEISGNYITSIVIEIQRGEERRI